MENKVTAVPLQIRLAAALAHCLPDSKLELTTPAGECVFAGRYEGCAISPCRLYVAVAAAMRDGAPEQLCGVLGLVGPRIAARLLVDADDDVHVGAGVFRYANDDAWGHVFATGLSGRRVRTLVLERSANALDGTTDDRTVVGRGRWYLVPNEEIAVTVCFSEYPLELAELAPAADALALEVAGACIVEELVCDSTETDGSVSR
jgi:hypothetical protein